MLDSKPVKISNVCKEPSVKLNSALLNSSLKNSPGLGDAKDFDGLLATEKT